LRRILVVDDDAELRQGLEQMLSALPDCEVVTAGGVREGRVHTSKGGWDIVISDEQMPDGRGSDLLAEASRLHPGTHYVLMSGMTDFGMLVKAVNAAPVDHFFQKPAEPERMLDWVQRTLNERASWGSTPPVRNGPFRRLGPPEPALEAPRAQLPIAPPAAAAPMPAAPPAPPARVPAQPPPAAMPRAIAAPPQLPSASRAVLAPPPPVARPSPPSPPPMAAPAPTPAAPPTAMHARAAPRPRNHARALTEALGRTVGEGLVDIDTLIAWAREAPQPEEALRHVHMAMRRMEDTARNLEAIVEARKGG
jgi:CheY-like chemotaxis protein